MVRPLVMERLPLILKIEDKRGGEGEAEKGVIVWKTRNTLIIRLRDYNGFLTNFRYVMAALHCSCL